MSLWRRCGRAAGSTAGSTSRIDNSTQRELSGYTSYPQARRQIEAVAPNLVLTAPRRALRSPTS